ncbi:hypothetical protein GOHSU_29_00030 [Gordonia hirsuta DSM 44140 = NBRC 16056]|uniref:DUF7144 domain-containing protein n=1 Tax=Gordonia hirsuta DSM 44140 = NBRC 16056 TaxID=1121927 RepID=L7LA75_9ACTN|nr:hypothetical protein [Gordonia hirsuta]GAC58020.1 hypothetical protein GOHSU_29_00030 [Gordonia hirsuta DSM 44140 = NBRC 16056]
MTTNPNDPGIVSTDPNRNNPWAVGTAWAAAALLLVASVLAFFQGIAAVANDETLVLVDTEYIYAFNLTTWGWIHIVLGIIGAAIAIGVFGGALWARACAIVIAALSIVANFLWLPYTPWWSILIIAIDILVIWAMANWTGDN